MCGWKRRGKVGKSNSEVHERGEKESHRSHGPPSSKKAFNVRHILAKTRRRYTSVTPALTSKLHAPPGADAGAPARDLGPRIMHAILPINDKGSSDWKYSWIPVIGPIAGGVLAALLSSFLGV